MNKFRWLKHFGWDSMLGQHLVGKGNNAPRPQRYEKARAVRVPPPHQFERRNYPEASR